VVDKSVDDAQLRELMIAVRRLIEGAREVHFNGSYVAVERIDFERLNRLAAGMPACL
jgi:hypothetical protein